MGEAPSGCGYKDRSHHWYQTWESCPSSSNGCFCGLMRTKVVHISLGCSVLLTGKSQSRHGGNSHSECECKSALFLN